MGVTNRQESTQLFSEGSLPKGPSHQKNWKTISYKKLETLTNKIAIFRNTNPKTIPPFYFNGEFRMGVPFLKVKC